MSHNVMTNYKRNHQKFVAYFGSVCGGAPPTNPYSNWYCMCGPKSSQGDKNGGTSRPRLAQLLTGERERNNLGERLCVLGAGRQNAHTFSCCDPSDWRG